MSVKRRYEGAIPPPKKRKLSEIVTENAQKMLQDDYLHDIEFIIGSQKKSFHGIRAMFALQSEPLKAMLYNGHHKESKQSEVIISDVSVDAFDYFHKLVHLQEPVLTIDIVVDVLYLANKYLIKRLITECEDTINGVSTSDDCYQLLKSFSKYAPSTFGDLVYLFLEFRCCSWMNQIFSEQDFDSSISIGIMQKILNSTAFNDDYLLYNTCKKYCKYVARNDNKNSSWTDIFKSDFSECFDFTKFDPNFLISTIRKDKIFNIDELLDNLEGNIKRNHTGFKLKSVLLDDMEIQKLVKIDSQNHDIPYVDIRNKDGKFINKGVFFSKTDRYGYAPVFCGRNNARIKIDKYTLAESGSISERYYISKQCMKQLKIGDYIYANSIYHPIQSKRIDKWIKCKIEGKLNAQIMVSSINSNAISKYYIHCDSQEEVACSVDCYVCKASCDSLY